MKKLIIAAILLCTLLAQAEIYPLIGIVVDVNYTDDTITIMDFNQNLWMLNGCEDWLINDMCALMMWDNNTDIIYDDVILTCHYNGWIEQWFHFKIGD